MIAFPDRKCKIGQTKFGVPVLFAVKQALQCHTKFSLYLQIWFRPYILH